MSSPFKIFNDYRIKKRLSYVKFAKMLDLPYMIVYNTLTGKTVPHDYYRECFKTFFENNKQDIIQTIGDMDEKNL